MDVPERRCRGDMHRHGWKVTDFLPAIEKRITVAATSGDREVIEEMIASTKSTDDSPTEPDKLEDAIPF